MSDSEAVGATAPTAARVTNLTLRRALFVGTAIVVAVWLAIIVFWHDAPYTLTFDDAWYYLTIGRNLAGGHGSTFDGLNLTNGYHPLWQVLVVVPFAIGLDDLQAARLVLVVQLLIGWGLTLVLLSATVSRVLRQWPPASRKRGALAGADHAGALTLAATLALVAGSPFVVKVFVNGLESGIAATCDAALLYLAVRQQGRWVTGTTVRGRLGVGALLAVTFLARTDAVFLLAALGLWCLAEAFSRRPPGAVLALVELFAIPAAVIAAYLYVNQRLFGTPWQISGLVKRAELTPASTGLFLVFVAIAVAVGWRSFRSTGQRRPAPRFPAAGEFVGQTGWFAGFCIVLVGYYSVLQVQQWLWYYAPVVLYLVGLLLLGVADMAAVALRDAPAGATAQRALRPVQIVIAVLLVGLLMFTGVQFFDPDLRSIQIANADAGRWMRDNLPPDARIASWDAGALGYFSHQHVINIDGVVNSYDYYDLLRAGQGQRFWACQGLGYVANHGGNTNGDDPDIRSFIDKVGGSAAANQSRTVYTLPFTYNGVIASSAGSDAGDARDLAVHVYQLPTALGADPVTCATIAKTS